jgi:large subunit ribosomal protein L7/L12
MGEIITEQAIGEAQARLKAYSPRIVAILDEIEKLTVLELKELKEAYEERFGVSAAVMVGPAAAAPAAAAEAPKEEKTTFDVFIDATGDKKIQVIKAVRQVVSLGLKEAKDFVDSVDSGSKPIKHGVTKEEAEKIKKILEESGATVSVK